MTAPREKGAGEPWMDANGGPPSALGQERFTVTWWTWINEDERDNDDGFLEDQTVTHSRAFPTRGLADAYARRLFANPPPLSMGEPQIRRERFDAFSSHERLGSWEEVML